jgi:hypothetical protein
MCAGRGQRYDASGASSEGETYPTRTGSCAPRMKAANVSKCCIRSPSPPKPTKVLTRSDGFTKSNLTGWNVSWGNGPLELDPLQTTNPHTFPQFDCAHTWLSSDYALRKIWRTYNETLTRRGVRPGAIVGTIREKRISHEIADLLRNCFESF